MSFYFYCCYSISLPDWSNIHIQGEGKVGWQLWENSILQGSEEEGRGSINSSLRIIFDMNYKMLSRKKSLMCSIALYESAHFKLPITALLKNFNSCPGCLWLSGLSVGLQSKGLPVRFPVRAHAWVVGQVPSRVHTRGNHTLMLLSLFFSFPSPLSKNK